MGSSKKHKDKDREHRHRHRKHRSRDGDRPREKHEDRKRQRDEGDELYDEDQDFTQPPVAVDDYEQYSAPAAPPSPAHKTQELTDEGY